MKLDTIITYFENIAPQKLAEDWDNTGLILGMGDQEIQKVLICLDVTSLVVEEAIKLKVELIISHHPMIFKGLKKITSNDVLGRNVMALLENRIAVYCAHTNLDFAHEGLNAYLAQKIGLGGIVNLKGLKGEKLFKIIVYVPDGYVDQVREAISGEGAGRLGNYSDCCFITKGIGMFRPLEGSNAYIGSIDELEKVEEYRLETVVAVSSLQNVVNAMIKAHPYEEVAYDIIELKQTIEEYGYGKIGHLEFPIEVCDFVTIIKKELGIKNVRVIGKMDKKIQRVGVFCGAFDETILSSINQMRDNKAIDILVTGDIKYHTAVDLLDRNLLVIDAGHFGTEKIVVELFRDALKRGFPSIETHISMAMCDPFHVC